MRMDFFAVHILLQDPVQIDLLTGQLTSLGFTGFEQRDDRLIACIPAADFPDQNELVALLSAQKLVFEMQAVPSTNWNAAWEQSFSPVRINDFCGIRASFHQPLEHVKHEIIITPRMTFGTGHHATTASMIRLMEGLDLAGTSVLDFGTGTGVLAILAARMGAAKVLGLDNDPAAVENAWQNARENGIGEQLSFACADRPDPRYGTFDCILVNIQLHVILQFWRELQVLLPPGGLLLVSGILEKDVRYLKDAAAKYAMIQENRLTETGWASLLLKKQPFHD